MEKDWAGTIPKKCDMCDKLIVGTFVNGKTYYGTQKIMCSVCYMLFGQSLGTDTGQLYNILGEKLKG